MTGEYLVTKYRSKYSQESKAIAVIWSVFAFCSTILHIVAFLSDDWVGASNESKGHGKFGLWKFCILIKRPSFVDNELSAMTGDNFSCTGSLDAFESILGPAFRAATVFVGLSVLMSIFCLLALFLLCILKPHSVFELCGIIQLFQGVCMGIGILCFPAGFDNDSVQGICGKEATDYSLGTCRLKWAFILGLICLIDAFILSILAFVVSNKLIKGGDDDTYMVPPPATSMKGGADGSPYGMHPRMIMVPPPPPPLSSSQYQISGGGFTPMGGLGVGGGPPPPHQQMGGAQMPPPPPNFASTESLNTKNHPHHHHQFQL